ncbi:hypothetical protein ACOMHN_000969 [Nucella lapillus]
METTPLEEIKQTLTNIATKDDVDRISGVISKMDASLTKRLNLLESKLYDLENQNDSLHTELKRLKEENSSLHQQLDRTHRETRSLQSPFPEPLKGHVYWRTVVPRRKTPQGVNYPGGAGLLRR